MTDYTEQDTERARAAQRSSAGVDTQHLSLPAGYAATAAPAAAPAAPRPNAIGMGLIGLGALLLLGQLFNNSLEVVPGMILLTIASVFLFFGLWRRIYGLIIPGSILGGLSVGVTFADLTNGVSVLWGLALGFLAIYALGAALFANRHFWPLIPGAILFGVGLIVLIATLGSLSLGLIWVPLLLIGAGLFLGFVKR
jgi:hypothetical protein